MRRLWPDIGNRGMALLITIMVISLLIAVTVQFNRNIRDNFFASAAQLDGQNLSLIARSGIAIGEAILEVDGKSSDFDTLQDPWATLSDEVFAGSFPRGSLHMEVVDLSGRLQVNSLVPDASGGGEGEAQNNASDNREILKSLLLSGRFLIEDENEAQELVDALVDWLDEDDDVSGFGGAESSYYRSLETPYECQNGSVTTIDELLLIKGFTAALLFGSDTQVGLADFLTVYGRDGKININTAPAELLIAMNPLMSEDLAESLIAYRKEELNLENLKDSNWYQNVPAWPGEIEFPGNVITTTSSFFEIRAQGVFNDQQRRVTAVIVRDQESSTSQIYKKVE